ncbi:MAG TPA: TIGR03086 family metal-binding protein [Acidimicrobiia bacterium]|nr:TIGR03086 family metal-binding protein [Acidimicrobiia bacterium]
MMSEIADRYRRLSSEFAGRIAAVPDDAWDNPSPCADWSARDVAWHVIETPKLFFGFIGREVTPPGRDVPIPEAFDQMRVRLQDALDDPAVATHEFDGFFGRTTFEQAVDRFVCFDLVVHGWDLAHATGTDERLDPAEVERLATRDLPALGDSIRSPGAFGEAVEAPAGADAQTRLLAYLGRRA